MLRLWFETALLVDGWARNVRIAIDQGRIAQVHPNVKPAANDEIHGAAIPGLPNVHSHSFQRVLAGLTERRGRADDDFWTWREQMYRALDRLDPDDVEAIAAQAFAEMLEAGFTRVGEFHYLHHDSSGTPYANVGEMAARIAAAANATGIGLTLLPVFYAHAGFGGIPPTPTQRRFVNTVDDYAKLLDASDRAIAGCDDANLGVAPHSLRAVTPEQLRDVVALARGRPVHIHVAEQLREVDDCLAWAGARPVHWLLDHAPVDRKWCLVHATHCTPDELTEIARRDAVVGLCPITEANLGDGNFDAAAFASTGGRFGIGSDSIVLIDAAGELRQLEYSQRLIHRRRNVLASGAQPSTGRNLFDGVLRGGSQALGLPASALAVGARANIVALDPRHPALSSKSSDQLLDAWIFASRNSPIDRVWRNGRLCVKEGKHVDSDSIFVRYQRVLGKLSN